MILLLGGTAETPELVRGLLDNGFQILLSTATDTELNLPASGKLRRICGMKNADELKALTTHEKIKTIICAVHPYAQQAIANARICAKDSGIKIFTYLRPESERPPSGAVIHEFADHSQAAENACKNHKKVLLTVGSRNLDIYAQAARKYRSELFVRLLDCQLSREAVVRNNLPAENVIFARGPFSCEDNCKLLEKSGASAIITKDGGRAGATAEKFRAAEIYKVEIYLIGRPQYDFSFFTSTDQLLKAVIEYHSGKLE